MTPEHLLEPDAARSALARHTALLFDTGRAVEDLTAHSLCDGWTRAHVLTHVARNADAIGRLVHWAVTGERREMYPGGREGRNADIAAGAARPRAEILADLEESSARVNTALEQVTGATASQEVEMRGGALVSAAELPFLRLREVVFHHVDLDAGFGFGQVEPELVEVFLRDAVERLRAHPKAPAVQIRTDRGDAWEVGEGGPTVAGPPAGMLLWLARRRPSEVTATLVPDLPRGA
jgi:maleylpyruvate isomerase